MTDFNLTFSVIIPVYNGGKYIQRAIDSCLQQTVLPDEIIVIDDASEDNTASIIHQVSAGNIVYKKNDTNRGPSFSRNVGLQLATSSWIMFLDADDVFHPKKIEIIRSCITNNHSIRAIGHSFNLQSDPIFQPAENWQQVVVPKEISVKQILASNKFVTPSFAVSTNNQLFFNEQLLFAEDHDFILRTTEQFGAWYIDLPLSSLSRLPLTPGGISSSKWKMRKGEMKMYIDYCKRHRLTVAIPFFLLFSLLKHWRNALFR